jgi:hypothetical protein
LAFELKWRQHSDFGYQRINGVLDETLFNTFEYLGKWWLPTTPALNIDGILSYTPKGRFELRLMLPLVEKALPFGLDLKLPVMNNSMVARVSPSFKRGLATPTGAARDLPERPTTLASRSLVCCSTTNRMPFLQPFFASEGG